MTKTQNALIAITTRMNMMRGSETFFAVHADFVDAMKMVKEPDVTLLISEETECFAEVLRRRNLIKTC